MRIAIVGSKGQVGWELTRRAPMFGHEVLAWDRDELDITDATAVDQTLTASGAAVVINAAAYTAVDRAEQEPELAFAVNRDGPAHLAAACARLNIPLLHISTDYVFDGRKTGPTSRGRSGLAPGCLWPQQMGRRRGGAPVVASALDPASELGVRDSGPQFRQDDFAAGAGARGTAVVADQFGCPTYAGDIADTLLFLAGRGAEMDAKAMWDTGAGWGTYHYCGEPATTWHGFASAIIERPEPMNHCRCGP